MFIHTCSKFMRYVHMFKKTILHYSLSFLNILRRQKQILAQRIKVTVQARWQPRLPGPLDNALFL